MNIKLMEAFSKKMADYIGNSDWKKMEEYLSKFDGYNPDEVSYFKFADDTQAHDVSKQIVEDAKTAANNGKSSPAINYILNRSAGMINSKFRELRASMRSTSATGSIRAGSYEDFTDYIAEAFITLEQKTLQKFDTSKYATGDMINNVTFMFGMDMNNTNRDILGEELGNGINYDGVRSKSVVGVNADGKYINKKTGEVISAAEAQKLKAAANVRRVAKTVSFDQTDDMNGDDSSGVGSSMDKLMKSYSDESGDNLGQFEDKVIQQMAEDETGDKWMECCGDSRWTQKDNIRARLLKTFLHDALTNTIQDQVSFIKATGMSKQTFRNYIGLSDKATYSGVTIPEILAGYELTMDELIDYCKRNMDKLDTILDMLPGERLHEALMRHLNGKRIREAIENTNTMATLSEEVQPYYTSFKSAVKEAVSSADWSNEDNVKVIFEAVLKDGIAAHKNTWKFMSGTFNFGLDESQKAVVRNILK